MEQRRGGAAERARKPRRERDGRGSGAFMVFLSNSRACTAEPNFLLLLLILILILIDPLSRIVVFCRTASTD